MRHSASTSTNSSRLPSKFPSLFQPSLRLYGRTWRTSTDMVPAIAVLTSTAHALFLVVFGILWWMVIPPADVMSGGFAGCPAALHYDIFMVGLLACFGLMLILELALIYTGMKGKKMGPARACHLFFFFFPPSKSR